MINNIHNPILVTGAERSGSTIIAKIIQICGAFTGETTTMLENVGIRQQVNSYYDQLQIPVQGQFPLPDTKQLLIPTQWKAGIDEILGGGGYDGRRPWMYKNHRICQIWPVWNYAYPSARWIIVRRRSGDIVQSCIKTNFMQAFSEPIRQEAVGANNENEAWIWWVREHEKLFVEMIQAGVNCKVVWPERMVNGDYAQIYEMLEWLGLRWNDGIINKIDPMLWKSRKREQTWRE